jgi:DNA-binding transcriptional LysR family regulator
MLNAVSTGRWVALLPALVQDIAHAGVVFCRLKQEDLKVKSYALTRLDENREIVASFIQELKKASMEVYAKYNT